MGKDILMRVDRDTGELLHDIVIGKKDRVNIRTPEQQKTDPFVLREEIKGGFIKKMELSKDARRKLKAFPATYIALCVLSENLLPDYNFVVKEDGKKFKVNDLAEEMGISRQGASRHLKILEDNKMIAQCRTKKGIFYVVNPMYFLNGKTLPKKILKLFE